jgi:hypothetical protein
LEAAKGEHYEKRYLSRVRAFAGVKELFKTINVRSGSKAILRAQQRRFRSNPVNGHHLTGSIGPIRAHTGSCATRPSNMSQTGLK